MPKKLIPQSVMLWSMLGLLVLALFATQLYVLVLWVAYFMWPLLIVGLPVVFALYAALAIYLRHRFANSRPRLALAVTLIFIFLPATAVVVSSISNLTRSSPEYTETYNEISFDQAQQMLAGSCELSAFPHFKDPTEARTVSEPDYAIIAISVSGDTSEQNRTKVTKDQWQDLLRTERRNASTPVCIEKNYGVKVESDYKIVSIDEFLAIANNVTCQADTVQLSKNQYVVKESNFHNVLQNGEYVSDSALGQAVGNWLAVTVPYNQSPEKEIYVGTYAVKPGEPNELQVFAIDSLGKSSIDIFYAKLPPCDTSSGSRYIYSK